MIDRPNVPRETPATPAAAPASAPTAAVPAPLIDPNSLTPEEQLALFEKELKETDWGHQPC